jgi:hypothetical protein
VNDHDVTVVLERLIEPLDDEVGSWDDVLGRAAEHPPEDWDEVLDPAGPARAPRPTLEPTRDREGRRRHRRRVIVLAAAALVVAVGTATAFGTVRDVFFGTVKPFVRGTQWQSVDGTRFSFKVPRAHPPSSWPWGNGPTDCFGPNAEVPCLYISKSTVGGQRAEAVIFWTSFPAGGEAAPCTAVVSTAIGRSTDALAHAMARAPGTQLVKGPTRVTVGGRPARHVVLTVRRDLGCDPGFFFTWQPSAPEGECWGAACWHGECWGACWLGTYAGDTISVWIVDVHGKRLVIEAETRQPDSQGWPLAIQVTRADVLKVEAEIEEIVGSIRFG